MKKSIVFMSVFAIAALSSPVLADSSPAGHRSRQPDGQWQQRQGQADSQGQQRQGQPDGQWQQRQGHSQDQNGQYQDQNGGQYQDQNGGQYQDQNGQYNGRDGAYGQNRNDGRNDRGAWNQGRNDRGQGRYGRGSDRGGYNDQYGQYDNFNRVLMRLDARIRQGYRSGYLTDREAGQLRGGLRDLRQRFASYQDDGFVSAREWNGLNRQAERLARTIDREMNDAQYR